MRGATAKNEKFEKARAFMAAHPEIGRTVPNWKRMGWKVLYASLAVRGAAWDKVSRTWYVRIDTSTAPKQNVKVTPNRAPDNSETVLVRIIASNAVINKAVAEMLEIARASNMVLLRNSGMSQTHDGRSQRVYLKFLLNASKKT